MYKRKQNMIPIDKMFVHFLDLHNIGQICAGLCIAVFLKTFNL